MIYLITGIPGSGKTLYAVSTLIKQLMGDKIQDKAGKLIDRRLVVDGIPNLAIPHEMMSATTIDDKTISIADDGHGVGNWWEWCKPGDVIVVDEVQRIWRPRAMGAKPPKMVTELETHRHKGVDFVIITQNPMLIDQNVRRLVGRHQHVRRLFGMARALIYDWDGCQADVHRVAAANKTMWAYPKAAYKLYSSAELHTKQKQKFPAWVLLPLVALVGGLMVAPKAISALSGAATGKGIAVPSALSASAPAQAPAGSPPVPVRPASAPAPAPAGPLPVHSASSPVPALPSADSVSASASSGCIYRPGRCKCLHGADFVVMPESACLERGMGVPAIALSPIPDKPAVVDGESLPLDKAEVDAIRASFQHPKDRFKSIDSAMVRSAF